MYFTGVIEGREGMLILNFFDNFMARNFLLMEEYVEANNPIAHVNTEFQ